ncbi:hypothetical protein JCM10908_003753 [Rhodotorula pacifica]|uniref:uncharacterized protein n=1 Tax=Rhodotorula pacifica TaxID=1495444 RepID=UPI003180C4CF
MASSERAHLHPLSFPLTHLDRLSSLELALIQFHLDNDDKAFGSTVKEARRIWRRRRRDAVDAGELLEGQQPPPSSSSRGHSHSTVKTTAPLALPPVPIQLRSLTQSLREMEAKGPAVGEPGPLASHIGAGMKARDRQVYSRDPTIKTFKDLQAAAEKLGVIVRGKGKTAGRDWLRLAEQYRLSDTPSAAPLRQSPPPPPSFANTPIPLRSPLPPSLLHLAKLDFDPNLNDLDLLPTHQLLLLQFRDDIEATGWTSQSERLWTRIERVFWRRRAAAFEHGDRWSSQLPVDHPLIRELDEALPLAIASALHVVQVDDLPDDRVGNVLALATLLPAHLQFVCATVSVPTFTAHTRTAFVAFRSAEVAASAQSFFAGLQIGPGETGLPAKCLPGSATSHWRWKDVRPDERLGLWQFHLDQLSSHALGTPSKRTYPGDLVAGSDAARDEKKARYHRPAEPARSRFTARDSAGRAGVLHTVNATDRIPVDLLDLAYPAVLLYEKVPRDLTTEHFCDDAWIHRFHADGYMVRQGQVYLIFSSGSERRAFGEWVKGPASRYWKKNGLAFRSLLPVDITDLDWQFGHFSPSWRHHFGYELAGTSSRTVGELGFGPDFPIAPFELGWFPFEYTQAGRPQPPPTLLPPHATSSRRASHAPNEPLAARLARAGSVAASVTSTRQGRTPTPTASVLGESRPDANGHAALPLIDEDGDVEMKPNLAELRRAEELASALRASTVDPTDRSTLATAIAPPPALAHATDSHATPSSVPLRISNNAMATPSDVSAGSPVELPTLVHATDQPTAASRLRRVTAMELMDFEDELEDFTASAAEAFLSSGAPSSAADSSEQVSGDAVSAPNVPTAALEREGLAKSDDSPSSRPVNDVPSNVDAAPSTTNGNAQVPQTDGSALSTTEAPRPEAICSVASTSTPSQLPPRIAFVANTDTVGAETSSEPPQTVSTISNATTNAVSTAPTPPALACQQSAPNATKAHDRLVASASPAAEAMIGYSSQVTGGAVDARQSGDGKTVSRGSQDVTTSNRSVRSLLPSPGIPGLPVKPSFAMAVPRDKTLL